MGDVEVGVQPQLAQPRADLLNVAQQLVAQLADRRVQRLVGAEELLLEVLPLRAQRRARLLGKRRRMLRRAALGVRRVGQHQPLAGAGHPDVEHAPHLRDVLLAGVRSAGAVRPLQQLRGDRLDQHPPRPRHPRGLQPADEDVVELQPLGGVHRQHGDRVVARWRAVLVLGVADPARLGHRRQPARELARRRLRRAPHVGRGQLADVRQRHQPFNNISLRGEDLRAPQPEALDQPVHEEVRARRVQHGGGVAVQLEERQDALARLRRQLGRLGRRDQPADHVELAALGDLDAAGEVDRVQLDRRPRQRADHGARVRGVDQEPQPREHVAHLGLAEERRGARQPERQRPLLQRDRELLALGAHRPHQHADPPGRDALAHQALDRGGHALGLRALARAAPQPDVAVGAASRSRSAVRGSVRPPSSRSAIGATTASAATTTRSGQRRLRGSRTTSIRRPPIGVSSSARSRSAAPRGSSIAWSSSAVATRSPWSAASRPITRAWAGVASSRSSTSTWRQRAATRARTCGRCSSSSCVRSTSSPKSSSPCSSSSRSWASKSPANSRSRSPRSPSCGQRRRPLAEAPRPDPGLLEPVDPRDDRAEHRGRPAAQVVAAQRQLVDAVQQQREAIGRRGGHRERIDPGLQRLVAQQPRAHAVDRQHRQLLERPVAERVLDAGAQRLGGGRGAREQQDLLGRGPARHEPGEAIDQRLRPAASRAAQDKQRPAAVVGSTFARDGGAVLGRDGAGGSGHDPRIWPR